MKLKMDEAGHVVVSDGKPVYIDSDGKDIAFDAPHTRETLISTRAEAATHRKAKEAAEAALKAFEGISDPAAALKAIDLLKNIDQKKLIDAGQVESVKAEAVKAYEEKLAAQAKSFADERSTLEKERDDIRGQYQNETLAARFANSEFVKSKTILPGAAAQKIFGEHFKIEDGRPVGYDRSGNKLFSPSRPGELANFDEAIEKIVDSYEYRKDILRGTGSGTGKDGDTNRQAGAKLMSRKEYDADPEAGAAKMKEGYRIG
jgi:hypothetical protein